MNFYTRKWVRPEDLNANGTLFGGSLLRWIDEEAAVYAIIQLGNGKVVTKYMSEIVFVSSAGRATSSRSASSRPGSAAPRSRCAPRPGTSSRTGAS